VNSFECPPEWPFIKEINISLYSTNKRTRKRILKVVCDFIDTLKVYFYNAGTFKENFAAI
jgi:hypothetical protein